MARYAIGVDYGTNSCRALLVDIDNGNEVVASVFPYPSGDDGILLDPKDPNLARQNAQDYIDGFLATVTEVVSKSGVDPNSVVGIGVDTTGSSPIPVDKNGRALSLDPQFRDHLASYCWLWKDHTSFAEAAEITEKAEAMGRPFLAKCGGTYSSEWFWSKILHCARVAPEVFEAAYSWVELCDFVPAYITGNTNPLTLKRSICAAGHKAMFSEEWGGLPDKEFLTALDPRLADLRDRLYTAAYASDEPMGGLTDEVAAKVGLRPGTVVAVGAFDAHMGAVGSGIKPGVLVKIMGTSTCDCMIAPEGAKVADIPGVCGIVPGSVVPGRIGIEAGQSAVGDIFNWFVDHLNPEEFGGENAHAKLTESAAKLKPGESGLLALDWNNGNRTILVDPLLSGLLIGQTLHTSAPEVFRALVEATAYGALTIIKRIEEFGVMIDEVVNCGGIAEKNPMVMQIYADVCNRPMRISRSAQTPALGAAIFGAVAAGAIEDVSAAQAKVTGTKDVVYHPIDENVAVYERLYALYLAVHDAFGGVNKTADLGGVMKELISIRQSARN